MIIWALVSRDCRETIELYFDEESARADLAAAVADEPSFAPLLDVVPLDWDELAKVAPPSFS